MDEYTAEILAKLAAKKNSGKAKAKGKPKAKSKAATLPVTMVKGKGKAKAKASPLPAKIGSSKAAPPEPDHGKCPPLHFLTCTIYSDVNAGCWRAIEKGNKRHDQKFKWAVPGNWARTVAWCREASKKTALKA